MFRKINHKMNCLVFALKLWFSSHMKSSLVIKRSIGLKGMIFHFLHIKEKNNLLFIEDYIPRNRKDTFLNQGDSFVFFDGEYRTRVYELKAESISSSLFKARKSVIKQLKNKE